MKIIVTTSDNYHHILPVFFTLYNRYWGDPFELVGYKKPDMELPENCTWVSLGVQRGPKFFGDDKREYFAAQEQYFIWLMEDYFIHSVNRQWLEELKAMMNPAIGRIGLTKDVTNRPHHAYSERLVAANDGTMYRQSTQPSIWNKDFLLRYMKNGLTPWEFETQPTHDNFIILGTVSNCVRNNEGTTKHDIHKLNLDGFDEETINELKPFLTGLTY